MDAIEQYFASYRAALFDDEGEAWGKTAALAALEEYLPDARVLDFFLRIVADPAEYDMARLHLLKLFEIDPVPDERQKIGTCVAVALPGEADWTVRCWLGRAVAAYSDIPVARAVAIARVLDADENEDVRYNCLSGLQAAAPDAVLVLQQLAAEESDFGIAARRHLARPPNA